MKSGDLCNTCPIGRLVVYSVHRGKDRHVRYLKCDTDTCNFHGKEIVPAQSIRRRRKSLLNKAN